MYSFTRNIVLILNLENQPSENFQTSRPRSNYFVMSRAFSFIIESVNTVNISLSKNLVSNVFSSSINFGFSVFLSLRKLSVNLNVFKILTAMYDLLDFKNFYESILPFLLVSILDFLVYV
ncbi:hypothetical protein DMUE_3007 [Dictyocoela muelleri]|nr:hypothetical protein DMUE_3007 [Dictyocoela muelleri]